MMFGEDYAYAVARIRVLETGLLNQAAIEQLLACQDEQQCLQILTEKGWGNGDPASGADAILSREREKTWEIMDSLVADRSVFSVLSYQDLFHNLKAAVKASILDGTTPNIFFSDCAIDGEDMVKFLKDKEYDRFPEDMREVARELFAHKRRTACGYYRRPGSTGCHKKSRRTVKRRDRPAVCGIHGCSSRYPDCSPCLQNRKKLGLHEKSHGRM